jgi:flagellar assembly factor FliW
MVEAITAPTTTVQLPRFGTCTYREAEVLTFPWGLPGFPDCQRFLALTVGAGTVLWLQSLDDLKVALPVADPWQFFPEYEPRLPSFARLSLALDRAEDFAVLAVTIIPEEGEATMNLMAPIIVNLRTRVARQVTVEGEEYSMRTPIPDIPLVNVTPTAEAPAE